MQFHSSCKLLSPSGRISMWPPILHRRLRSPSLGCMDLCAHHLLGFTVLLIPSTRSQPLLPLPMFAHCLPSATAILFWQFFACVRAQSLQSCPTLCNPMDCSLPGSSVHGILQASRLPCPPPGDVPDPGIQPASPALAGGFFTTSTTWETPR